MQSRFNWVLQGQAAGPNPKCDIDLLRGQSVAAVPSLGSLFPGWLLAIPRRRLLSLRQLDSSHRMDFLKICGSIGRKLDAFSPQVYYFEHGPVLEQSKVGCGVDQAHLHLVPTQQPLMKEVLADRTVIWVEVDSSDPWADVPVGVEYYFISDAAKSYVGLPREPQSQFFRRKLAALKGNPDQWDYRNWPHYEHIQRTIDHFSLEPANEAA